MCAERCPGGEAAAERGRPPPGSAAPRRALPPAGRRLPPRGGERARAMSSARGFLGGYFCLASRAAGRRSPLLCQRAAGASSALPGLPLLGGARRRLLALRGLSPAARCAAGAGAGAGPCATRRRGCGGLGAAGGGFRPSRVAVVVKTTRYEFEQQRYRYAGLSEEDLKQLLALKGSNYAGLLERHRIHTKNVEHVVDSLRNEKIEVRLVKRREYNEETVRWADAVISAGGDGTMLLAASKVFDKFKPVIGVNTDPERSEGHLCLPVRYTHSFPEALQKLYRGEFRWQWRQRIRLYLEGTGINPTPVDLHEQQLSQEQHSRAHISERFQDQRSDISGPHLLPVRALNEVFIGESLSSRASYYEISVDDGPWEKQKSSGLNVCTGTGSKAWSYNINKVAHQAVEEILKIAKKHGSLTMPLNTELVQKVTNDYNESLLYSPEEPKMFFSIREPIVNRVFSSSRQRGFSSKVCVRSRCWDACMVVDGGTSFEFNDGAIASIMIDTEDALCTVLLEE
ncbi:NAD kinase 2, mitochondrial isoform X2 [Aquila chrysaetos chrysaetos]|uniref:NAD kinase 2, mitochondrial isoform X2 n=1 Tax=Aquila chrysaetos chrysaetos TaxID=223781 RepID=UPI001176B6E6|nr:NAD kinase 2, mitochondrial isoform X2 [Aquila chrysaetos chrysaetos]